jgi:copper chaperone CopZ
MKARQRALAKSVATAMARTTERIPVTGLDCADCGADMRAAVRQLPGVQAVAVNVGSQEIAVTFDPTRTDVPAIRAHMATVGIGCR